MTLEGFSFSVKSDQEACIIFLLFLLFSLPFRLEHIVTRLSQRFSLYGLLYAICKTTFVTFSIFGWQDASLKVCGILVFPTFFESFNL